MKALLISIFLVAFVPFLKSQVGHSPLEQHRWVVLADSLAAVPNASPEAFIQSLQKTVPAAADFLPLHFGLGKFYYKKRNFKEALSLLEKTEQIPCSNAADRAAVLYLLAQTLNYSQKPATSLHFLEQSLVAATGAYGVESHSVARIFIEFANIYREGGDFDKSEDYGKKAARMLRSLGLTEHRDYGGVHHNLGLTAYYEGDYQKSIENYQIALANFEKSFGEHPQTAICLSTIGSVFSKLKNGDTALRYQLRATEMFRKTAAAGHPALPVFHICTATAYRVLGQNDMALKELLLAKSLEKYPLPSPELCMGLAETYRMQGNFEQAIAFLDTALIGLKFSPDANWHEPSNREFIWEVLLLRAAVQTEISKKNGNTQKLADAATTMKTAREVILSLLSEFDEKQNKMAFYRQAVRGFDKSVSIHADLWAATGDVSHLWAAFENSEASKSLLLRQQLHAQRNRRAPAHLVEQEAQLQQKIVEVEKNIFEEKNTTQDNLSDSLFQLKTKLAKLHEQILKVAPDYFDQLPKLKLAVLPEQPLLEFFIGEEEIFIFLVKNEGITLRRVPNDFDLNHRVAMLRESICRYFLSEEKKSEIYLSSAKDFAENAYFLYEILLKPLANDLPERLTIVPDGVLNYLPFEALLTEPAMRPDRFHLLQYFVKQHTISYSYSASLLHDLQHAGENAHPPNQKLMALAPFFDASPSVADSLLVAWRKDGFYLLPFSGEEAVNIARIVGGKAYTHTAANKSFFVNNAPKFKILHLATHGQANDRAGDYSFLCFRSADGTDIEKLYVSEISGMRLAAELVTLSACETGLGQLLLGEGMVSIARAFMSAGTRSLVQTLWVVSDASTNILMTYFYENLKKGMAKDVALDRARKSYLQHARGETAHPYFWAGMVLLGDVRALPSGF